MINIRDYQRGDALQLEHCIVELQSFEKTLDSNRADGHSIAGAYRRVLLNQCRRSGGRIFVAESGDEVTGFVCVLARVDSKQLTEADSRHAYVTDLVVLPGYRNAGVGKALLQKAEEYVRASGGSVLKVDVLAANSVALDLYTSMGYVEQEIRLSKLLDAGSV